MNLYTKEQYEQLIKNGSPENQYNDHYPVIKIFMPGTGCTWLITELNPKTPSIAFGLCDLGMGFPELGYVDLEEISQVKNRLGLGIEADLYFKAKFPISVYARAAYEMETIVEVEPILNKYVP